MMPKRLADTDIWKKVWFRELTPEYKCFVKYIFDQCDHAGVWEVDFEMANAHIRGKPIIKDEAAELLKRHFIEVSDGKRWYLKDFIFFQYKCQPWELSPEKNNAHLGILRVLMQYDILSLVCPDQETFNGIIAGAKLGRRPVPRTFVKPSVDDVKAYMKKIGLNDQDAIDFYARQETTGWVVSVGHVLKPMVNWHGACVTWKQKKKQWDDERNSSRPHLQIAEPGRMWTCTSCGEKMLESRQYGHECPGVKPLSSEIIDEIKTSIGKGKENDRNA